MSRPRGDASAAAGATAHGGLLVIEGNASAPCGISMKGIDIVVGGNVGHMSAFMGQAGKLTVLGDTGESLGDSIYEAQLFVRGTVASLGADCIEKPMRDDHRAALAARLRRAGFADADGQYEMNWTYAPALVTADRHTFFKYMVRTIAERHGMRATFMPKPFADLTGSGCHAHISAWRDGANLFKGDDALGLSVDAGHFLGGLLAHADALCALTNPTVNSYKRINAPVTLSGATWSPSTISWGGNNRTHMVRVPGPGRLEYRLADGAANPYLLQTALLAAGLDGLAQARDPGPRVDLDMYTVGQGMPGVRRLPLNLLDAVRAFEASVPLQAALGAPFCAAYAKLKRAEWDSYMRHLTQWERGTTLDC